jgi:hypothetical protein
MKRCKACGSVIYDYDASLYRQAFEALLNKFTPEEYTKYRDIILSFHSIKCNETREIE